MCTKRDAERPFDPPALASRNGSRASWWCHRFRIFGMAPNLFAAYAMSASGSETAMHSDSNFA